MAGRPTIRTRAFAKINLELRVTGIRADGYHELRTVLQSIALHDTLTFTTSTGPFRLETSDPACPADRRNLVWRAAELVWRAGGHRGPPRNVAVRILKRIPMQSGLGGGSSDAAAAIRALSKLWRVRAACEELYAIASELGADVPFFLQGGTVLGLERGDLLFPLLDAPGAWVVLALPDFGVSTKDAYAWWDAHHATRFERIGDRGAGHSGNDLERPVAERHPEILRLVQALRRHDAWHAAMSGSGSSVFGLFARREQAESAAARLDVRTVVGRTLNRASYQRLAGIPAHRIHLPFAPRHVGHS